MSQTYALHPPSHFHPPFIFILNRPKTKAEIIAAPGSLFTTQLTIRGRYVEETAAFVTTACNSYHSLLEQLKIAIFELETLGRNEVAMASMRDAVSAATKAGEA